MVDLIIFGLLVGLGLGMLILGISGLIAWIAHRLLPNVYENTLALVSSGLMPLGLLAWIVVSLVFDDGGLSGPAAQGLLVIMVALVVLLTFIWPISYRINLKLVQPTSE